ncbi:olfactomedin-like protein 2B [Bombina bombina]|uniref:olfactomedin-like protein 2B n=1 Tax=Bombina bombina TaxID=8345 RepID=UPI00235B006A|nr:olfactomedin-like protein 2B [Bombina bombina]
MDLSKGLLLLFVCGFYLSMGTVATGNHNKAQSQTTVQPSVPPSPGPTESLEDEADNQENILSQLLGDYDKVKAISEGSNCKCKCVVKPLKRDSCQRVESGNTQEDDFYTVETITSGPDCKCACVAPPSALNPCEGDFRLKKLRETENNGFKLSNIIEMLEGAFYGLDLLKLHSVTTKIVGRVEKLEEVVSKNLTKEQEQIKDSVDEIRTEIQKEKENCTRCAKDNLSDIGKILQRDAAAAYTRTDDKYEERFIKDEHKKDINLKPRAPAPPQQVKRRPLSHRQVQIRAKPAPKPSIIRGVTFYKAKVTDDESDLEEQDEFFSGDNAIDMLIEDQLIKHRAHYPSTTEEPIPTSGPMTSNYAEVTSPTELSKSFSSSSENSVPTYTSEDLPVTTDQGTTPLITTEQATTAQIPTTTTTVTTTNVLTTETTEEPEVLIVTTRESTTTEKRTSAATTVSPLQSEPVTVSGKPLKPTIGNPEDTKGDEDDLQKVIGRCKDTLSTISGPTTHNTYGRNEGAWMKDPLAKDDKIYVTNYYYGNTLVEFRNLDNFKQGRWSNSYKLPYSWIGTGHVVYNGSFYYNRAFTRNIIKYDLKQRYVAAWSMLHDVVYEEATPWRWRGHSDIDFAVDENGLWVIYPAIDDESFQQEVIVLSKLNSIDLTIQKETTWRTGLRKDFYGNCFVICGVLYAVDSYNKKNANISYAFDTHTNTQIIPRLLFENEYSYTTQIDYNPKDRLLYAWDNGHQVTYHVIFAY